MSLIIKQNLYTFTFVQLVLCFSPVGSTLRQRSRKFPAIINCTAINFFNEWPKSALESVAKKFLNKDVTLSVRFEQKPFFFRIADDFLGFNNNRFV